MEEDNQIRLIWHRWSINDSPENTLQSFLSAKEKWASWIEFDVSYTNKNILLIGNNILSHMYCFVGPYQPFSKTSYFVAAKEDVVNISRIFKNTLANMDKQILTSDTYLDLVDEQALEANYLNSRIKGHK